LSIGPAAANVVPMNDTPSPFRAGIDLGGTKIEIAVLGPDGGLPIRRRVPTPDTYEKVVVAVRDLVQGAEAELGAALSVGVCIPGVISPSSRTIENCNALYLNGRALDRDLSNAMAREVRVANDANCFALSEAADGAGAGKSVVFGVILGSGVGGGLVVDGKIVAGRHAITGEWGHIPLPWLRPEETPGIHCWCGFWNCLEMWLAGPGLAADCDGPGARDAGELPARAAAGDAKAQAALDRHVDRLARGLGMVIAILDPDVLVLGGGLSNMAHLYEQVPPLLPRYVRSESITTPLVKNVHGDSSGVRGAAWLWPA